MPPAARPALPSNLNQWNTEARNHGVSDTSIHDLLDFDSASKIGPRQYYSLRVLWVVAPKLPDASFLDLSQDDPNYRKASDFLSNKSQSWKDYLKDIKDKPGLSSANKAQDIGAFSNVRYYQLHVDPSTTASSSTPDKDMESVPSKFSRRYPPSAIPASTTSMTQTTPLKGQQSIESRFFSDFNTPFNDNSLLSVDSFKPPTPQTPATPRTTAPAEDEQIVNVALVLWLQTLTMFHTGVQEGGLKWSMKRLKLDFDTWEARTDGCLRRKQEIKAILEVKPFVRQKCLDLIQEQETAQMCAWIRNFPDVGGWSVVKRGGKFERRLLVSQDSREIYLTVAEFEPEYKEYLQQIKTQKRSFMTMYQHGPWDTGSEGHMRQLGKILLAFTLRCGETSNDTMRSKRTPPPTAKKSETLQKWTNKSIGMARTTETTEMTERTGMTGMTGTTAPPETIELPLRRSARTKKDATTENPAPPKVPANWKTENTEKTGTTGTIEKPETLEKPEKSANGKGIFD